MHIPSCVLETMDKIRQAKYSVEIVGGAVRDLLLAKEVGDWDLASQARPEQLLEIFPEAKYENSFGTVILPIYKDMETKQDLERVLEITTYRSEGAYSDKRHPDELKFEDSIDKDLERRDFTINALALRLEDTAKLQISGRNFELIDLFGGEKDIKKQIIRSVGEPSERFKEDALRLMRAIRFTSQLNFKLEDKTKRAITKLAGAIKFVAKERIRDELIKILKSTKPELGISLLLETKLLQYIMPELVEGIGVKQNHHHKYDVFKHNLLSLKHCPSPEWQVRLAALTHDIGKVRSKRFIKGQATFYNHEYIGAKILDRLMQRLKFSNQDRERVVNLVRNHMFYYNVGEVTEASVRRLIKKVGKENLKDLIDLRVADRLGSGTPKAMPYKLRHLQYMMEKVQHDPISVKMLSLNGDILITELGLSPGPKIGAILDLLLAEALEDPQRNTKEFLLQRAKEIKDKDLEQLRKEAKALISTEQDAEDQKMQNKFKV